MEHCELKSVRCRVYGLWHCRHFLDRCRKYRALCSSRLLKSNTTAPLFAVPAAPRSTDFPLFSTSLSPCSRVQQQMGSISRNLAPHHRYLSPKTCLVTAMSPSWSQTTPRRLPAPALVSPDKNQTLVAVAEDLLFRCPLQSHSCQFFGRRRGRRKGLRSV